MTAHVKNGQIELDEPVELPEGTKLEVELVKQEEEETPTLLEQFAGLIGIAKGLPSDMARNHDHYLHGLPKK